MRKLPATVAMLLLGSSTSPLAANVFRCLAPDGHVTYTLHGCSAGERQEIRNAASPTPGSGRPTPLAKEDSHTRKHLAEGHDRRTLSIVGQKDDGCGNRITGQARRKAIIKRQIHSGMTRADVESALGKPDKITGDNGRNRYIYRGSRGHSRQISFDENGCVTNGH